MEYMKLKYVCPNCQKERQQDFPISDETDKKYCPSCNEDIPNTTIKASELAKKMGIPFTQL
jgi:rubrerythrin